MPSTKLRLKVRVQRVCYPPLMQDGDWYILATDRGTCKGKMPWRPEEDEPLQLEGEWTAYQGQREFKFYAAIPDIPVDPRDQLRLVCERTHGIGRVMERKIWEAAGRDWKDIEPGAVRGFNEETYARFCEQRDALVREAEKNQAVAWMMGKGATMEMGTAAWEKWQQSTIGVVNENCYRLADLPHYGFTHVDKKIAKEFGIEDNDDRRVRAAIIYAIQQHSSGGSTTMSWPMLRDSVVKLLKHVPAKHVAEMVSAMFKDGTLKGFAQSERIALTVDYDNELAVWEFANAESEALT